jgi:hypothetical protein
MNQKIEFDDATRAINYAGMTTSADGVVTSRPGMTVEDVIYRIATVTAVLFILITMV